MHEVGIIQSTLELAESEARKGGATGISEVRMRVGRLTGVVPEALETAFAVLRAGTLAEGATLAVDYVPGACWCLSCSFEFETDGLFGECPRCGEASPDVRRGTEMQLVSLEVY